MIIRHKFCYILVWSKLVWLYFQLPDGQYSDQQKETGQNNTHLSLKLDIQKGHSLKTKHNFFLGSLGDVTQDDSQRRFLAQHCVAMLEQCCNHLKQCRNNVATLCCAKNRRCESCRVTSPLSSNDSDGFEEPSLEKVNSRWLPTLSGLLFHLGKFIKFSSWI